MAIATAALEEICSTMFMIEVKASGGIKRLDPEPLSFGGCVTLLHDSGSWGLAVYATKSAGIGLWATINGLDVEEAADEVDPSEIVDALGEISNMVAGTMKTALESRTSGGIGTTPPLFLFDQDCGKHLPLAIPVQAQAFVTDQFSGEIYLTWTERTPEALLSEIRASLEISASGDKMGLTQSIALFQEFDDALPDVMREQVGHWIEAAEHVLTDLVNSDRCQTESTAWLHSVAAALSLTLVGRTEALNELPPAPTLAGAQDGAQSTPLAACDRDDETVEMIGDFLVEGDDGLDQADQLLMSAEGQNEKDTLETVDSLFRIYHTIKGVSGFLEMAEITALAHTTETMMARVRDGELALIGPVLDLTFASTEVMRQLLALVREAVDAGTLIGTSTQLPHLLTRLEAAISGQSIPAPATPLAEQSATTTQKPKSKIKEVLKIDVGLVADLDAVVQELSTLDPLLNRGRDFLADAPAEITAAIESYTQLCAGLRNVSAKMRMLSLGSVFQKMARMVRDLAKKTDKLAKMVVTGEDTLVARGMIDKISDPLVHLVRNAVDHGIETQDERQRSRKPMLAIIKLQARHEANRLIVEIGEDGRGLDPAKLIKSAIEKGVIEAGTELTDDEAYGLIFRAGFSTAAQVSSISGRGVGMDVVKRNVEAMNGEIEIMSKLGVGTTFRMILPLLD